MTDDKPFYIQINDDSISACYRVNVMWRGGGHSHSELILGLYHACYIDSERE